jgi:hypothetical protein
MVEFAALTEYFVVIVMVACILVGYILKHSTFFKGIPNDDIPVILAVFGAVLNLFVSGITIESAVYGALMGLASTGLHQAFKEWLKNIKSK